MSSESIQEEKEMVKVTGVALINEIGDLVEDDKYKELRPEMKIGILLCIAEAIAEMHIIDKNLLGAISAMVDALAVYSRSVIKGEMDEPKH